MSKKIIKDYIFQWMIAGIMSVIILTLLGMPIKIFIMLAGLTIGTVIVIPLNIVLDRKLERFKERLEKEHNETMIDLYSNITKPNGR